MACRKEKDYILPKVQALQSAPFKILSDWFIVNRRDLPWRKEKNAYRVWISEIMLQQTQAKTVIPYFERFMHCFPDIESLAKAEEAELLKMWEGLGYYSRAQNIHKAAKLISARYHGEFPENYSDIIALPGIGSYTAGAIASFAFNQAYPAVDGNVLRVLSRFLNEKWQNGNTKDIRTIEKILRQYYDSESFRTSHLSVALINEALIELGASLCGVKRTECALCPWNSQCRSLAEGTIHKRPLPKQKIKQSSSDYTVLLLWDAESDEVLVEKRPDTGLLASLWQFPMLEGHRSSEELAHYLDEFEIPFKGITKLAKKTHVFSHLRWNLQAYLIKVKKLEPLLFSEGIEDTKENSVWINRNALMDLTFSAALFDYRNLLSLL